MTNSADPDQLASSALHCLLRQGMSGSYVCSICACLDLSVSSSSWCLGRAAVCDCGTPWTFLLPFVLISNV